MNRWNSERRVKHAVLFELSRVVTEEDESQTDYWLNMLHDNGYLNDTQYESLNHDGVRILKCLTAIVKSMKSKLGKQK